MKARVDIFRPLAAAARGCRPDPSCGPTSIFRRGNSRRGSQDEDERSYVVSVPEAWPPHPEALSASASEERRLDRSAPLPSGTSEEGGDVSPLGASRRSSLGISTSSRSRGKGRSTSPFKRRRKKAEKAEKTPPSYYRIELVGDGAERGQQVQLTSGDDASVRIASDHNEGLKLASSSVSLGDGRGKAKIIRASPVVEHEAVEAAPAGDDKGGWTVTSADGKIVIKTKGNNEEPQQADKDKAEEEPSQADKDKLAAKDEKAAKKEKATKIKLPPKDELSTPPGLVKANSSHSSASSRSSDSFLAGPKGLPHASTPEEGKPRPAGTPPLESPPRMNRSVLDESLFQDSVNSSSKESATGRAGAPVRQGSQSSGGSDAKRSRCGPSRLPDLFSQMLDIFSMNGGCCAQATNCSG